MLLDTGLLPLISSEAIFVDFVTQNIKGCLPLTESFSFSVVSCVFIWRNGQEGRDMLL